jgi:hypothetical protein
MKVNLTIGIPAWLDRICAWPVMEYRKYKYGYDYRRINLGEGRFAIVDQEDFYRLNNFHWGAKGEDQLIYAMRFVIEPNKKGKIVSMHREMMNAPKGLLVDHRNGDTLDNRRSNLRLATHSQNMSNRGKLKKKATSQYIGIFLEKSSGRWVVKTTHNNKSIWIGRFDSEIDAARAYDRAAIKYHGEFARLNFPREDYIDEVNALKKNA